MTQNGLPHIVALQYETVWLDSNKYEDAERQFQEHLAQSNKSGLSKVDHQLDKRIKNEATPISSLACEIANVREKIKNFLKNGDTKISETDNSRNLLERIEDLEKERTVINQTLSDTLAKLDEMCIKVHKMEAAMKSLNLSPELEAKSNTDVVSKNGPSNAADDDDDVDLFGSDEETEEEAKIKMERLKAYENKKSKKPALVAKSSVVLDVKPWSDETDMKELEVAVRKIECDGLKWGAGKLVPLAYGIKKFQVVAVVEDDKVSIDWLQETIQEIEDLVQSVDIAAFNKL